MSILEIKTQPRKQEAADGRFSLYGGLADHPNFEAELRHGIECGKKLPELDRRAKLAKQVLDAFTESDWRNHRRNVTDLISGTLSKEQRRATYIVENLKDEANHHQDAEGLFRRVGSQAVSFVLEQVDSITNIGEHSYWLRRSDEDGQSYLCSTDDTCDPIVYFGRTSTPTDELGSRLATNDDLLRLMYDISISLLDEELAA